MLQSGKHKEIILEVMSSSLNVQLRESCGSRQSRRLRHNGLVPGIIYGADKKPLMVSINRKELSKECNNSLFFNRVISLNTGKEVEKVLPKSIFCHPVSGDVLHVDFMRIAKGTKVKIMIPVETINEEKSPGIKKGGIINLVVHRLECLCNPERIPENLKLDLTGKEIGDSFLLENINIPTGVEPVNAVRDNVLATIVVSKVGKEEDKVSTTSSTTSESPVTVSQPTKSE